MLQAVIEILKKYGLWHLLWFTILFSVLLTALMTAVMGSLWGNLSLDLLLICVIDAFIVSSIAASLAIFLMANLIDSEKKAKEEVRLLNEQLECRVRERTAELAESEERYRLLMEHASDAIFITDRERNYIAVNSKACEMLGYSREELLSMKIEDVTRDVDMEDMKAGFRKVLGGQTHVRERLLRRKGGTFLPVEISVKMPDATSVQAIVRDISERKKAEEERGRMQARLMDAQKMEAIGRLAGGIAHDFNNLLTVIKGESSAAIAEMDESHSSREPIMQIYLSATRAGELVRKLLVFSRQQPMQPVMVDLNAAVSEMMAILGRLIGENIAVEGSLAPGLWTISADRVSLEQVIMNLVVNARDAMPSGGRLFIRTGNIKIGKKECELISGSRPGKFVFLEVEDTGIGMDPELARNIYDPFYSSKEIGKGTGLGLSVVYGIVEQHNGWISLKTEEGKGSKFSIYFEAVEGRPEVSAARSLDLSGLVGNGERILLVEDEEGIVLFAGRLLERHGYRVFPASDVKKAVEVFEREHGDFSLVFTDIILPDESGIELVGRLHEIKPRLPVLMSSGYSDHRTQWPVINEKGYKLLEKPYTAEALLSAVREAIYHAATADQG